MRAPHSIADGPRGGVLTVIPREEDGSPDWTPGLAPLGLAEGRDGLLYVPAGYEPTRPAPLVVMLHGAGADAANVIDLFVPTADARGCVVLAPDSRGRTWDLILGGYGPDVAFIDRALKHAFARYAIRSDHVAVGGFSDGASYALSLGIDNGDLFSDILAFSPGYMAPSREADSPRIFIAHGIHDRVLPIEPCSRRLVPLLRQAGYDVEYREFDGAHVVSPEMVDAAATRFLG